MFKKNVFITGATGFIGSHTAASMLRNGCRVVAMSRNKNGLGSRDRLVEAISNVDNEIIINESNLIHIPLDIEDGSDSWRTEVRKICNSDFDEVWHLAAIFNINKQKKDEVERVNIKGVQEILKFVETINNDSPPRFFHVSTAFSCGKKDGIVEERLHERESEFRSLYDWSKSGGEHTVAEYQKMLGLDATIFRPSIVIGALDSKAINNAAYYKVLETIYSVKTKAQINLGNKFDGDIGIRFWCEPGAKLHLVPVDYVVDMMVKISNHPHGYSKELKIFNVVDENPKPIRFIKDVICKSLDITGWELVPREEFETVPMTPLERFFDRRITFQAPYTRENIQFSTKNVRKLFNDDSQSKLEIDEKFLLNINSNFLEYHQNKLSNR